jgi:hypothetical protein
LNFEPAQTGTQAARSMRAFFTPTRKATVHDNLKHGIDAAAAGTAFASLAGLIPSLASVLSIIWLSIQIGNWFWKTFLKKDAHDL